MLTASMIITLVIVIAMIVAIISDKLPFGAPPLIACALLVVTNQATVAQAFGGFVDKNVIMIAGFMASMAALQKTSFIASLKRALGNMAGKGGYKNYVLLLLMIMRACEMVRTDIAYPNLPVRIVSTHSGLSMGNGGTTHHATEDLSIMRSMPNMTVIVPADPRQCARILKETLHHPGPIYMRIGRGAEPVIYQEDMEYDWKIGQAITVRDGDDVTVFATSFTIMNSIFAAERLEEDDGIHLRIMDMHTIKPIDREAIIKAAKETKAILTVEDHSIIGGLGSVVAEVLAEEGISIPFRRIGVPDVFSVIGEPEQLHNRYGYDDEGIYNAVKSLLQK